MDKSYQELVKIFKAWLITQDPIVRSGDRGDTVVKIKQVSRRIPAGAPTRTSLTHKARFR